MIVLIILAAVWAVVLVPPFLRNRRDARPDNSVVSFRAQLSTLERATPGTSLRSMAHASSMSPRSAPMMPMFMNRSDAKRRRREILVGLLGMTGFMFLLLVAFGGTVITLLFLVAATALGTYVFALRQLQMRSTERVAKVRTLGPRTMPAPVLAYRQSAAH